MGHISIQILYFLLLNAVLSASHNRRNIDDSTIIIPGKNCQPTSAVQEILSYSFLKGNCKKIEESNRIIIESSFNGIEDNLLENLPRIESLQGNRLNFTTIHFRSFKLKNIDFSRNEISTFKLIVYENLRSLALPHNKLRNLMLSPAKKEENHLEILDISHNDIRQINSFSEFPNLRFLDFSWNKIDQLLPQTFHRLENLVLLNLSFNKLSSLPECLICTLQSLEYLDISNNHLSKIDGTYLQPLKNLKFLDLKGNRIKGTNYEMLMNKNTYLEEARIENKIFKCAILSLDQKSNYSDSTCFSLQNSTKSCCAPNVLNISKRSVPNSHFHATVNNRKFAHNVTAIASQETVTKPSEPVVLKDFYGKLHNLNVENIRTLINATLNKIDSSISQLDHKIDYEYETMNSKLKEINETLSDIFLEVSDMNMDNGDKTNPNYVMSKNTTEDEKSDDILYLIRLCFFLLLISVILAILRIVITIKSSRISKKYSMNLLNLESMDNH